MPTQPTDDRDRRLRHLETLCRRQQATIGALENRVRHLENELTLERAESKRLREELVQEREAQRCTRENLADLLRCVDTIDERVKAWVRRQYLTSSERSVVDPGQRCLADIIEQVRDEHGEVIAEAAAAGGGDGDGDEDRDGEESTEGTAAAAPATSKRKRRKRPANAGGRKPLPPDLPREEVTYEPPEDHPILAMAAERKRIGTTTIERLDISPVRVVVQVMTCPVYSLRLPGGGRTQQTMTPPGVIERGQVSDRFLVTSAVDKVQDHLPAHRQQQRFARAGAEIPRSKLCRWHMRLAQFLTPVAEAVLDEIRAAPVLGIDDTVHRLLSPDQHTCKHGRLIAVSAPPGIFYQFQETRQAKWFTQLLDGYSGTVMGDAYSGHGQFLARDDILGLFCWAHARRKFFDSGDKRRRGIMLDLIGKLYAIEDAIAEQPPDIRVAERRRQAGPVLAHIHELLTSWHADPEVLPKSGIGNAVDYVLKRWSGFTAYLDIGHAPIDNNHTERGMRPNALHRKNSLFSASRTGAESYATLLTLTQSAWLHDLDPHAYLLGVIDHIHHRSRSVEELTPLAYGSRRECLVGQGS